LPSLISSVVVSESEVATIRKLISIVNEPQDFSKETVGMYKRIIPIIVAIKAIDFSALPVSAQSDSNVVITQCNAVVADVKQKISEGRSVNVTIESINIAKLYPDYPRRYPLGYVIRLEGRASTTIMESPQFLSTVTEMILSRCQPASLVTFAVEQTDWDITFGRIGDNRFKEFECIYPSLERQEVTWGYRICV